MKDTEFAYAVARVRANENKLLSSSGIDSLINSADYREALRLLSDMGYEKIETLGEERVLSDVLARAFELIYSSAPDKSCLDFLVVKNDFHNIKAILKCMIANISADEFIVSPSIVEAKLIKTALETKDYSILPGFLAETVQNAYDLITTTMDGQKLEIYLDKKSLETSIFLAKLSRDDFSVSLANFICMISDIKIALRCHKTNRDKEFILSALADCCLVDLNRLCDAALNDQNALCEYVNLLGLGSVADSIGAGYAAFEKTCDDLIMEKIKDAKYKCLGIAPLIAYYFAVDAEVKTVRIVLSCKKNGIDAESIRERVRLLYV